MTRSAVLLTAVALLVLGVVGILTRKPDAPPVTSERPMVLSAVVVPAPIESLTRDEVRVWAHFGDGTVAPLTTIPRVLTIAEQRERAFREAVADSPWRETPEEVVAVSRDEGGFRSDAIGDQGRAFGDMQVRSDAHPDLAARFDLLDRRQNLIAAWIVFTERGGWKNWCTAARKAGLLP